MIPVCGNTYMMLHDSRYKKDFEYFGDFSTHFGIFEGCGENSPFNELGTNSEENCC
jgi:hypothetical protein